MTELEFRKSRNPSPEKAIPINMLKESTYVAEGCVLDPPRLKQYILVTSVTLILRLRE